MNMSQLCFTSVTNIIAIEAACERMKTLDWQTTGYTCLRLDIPVWPIKRKNHAFSNVSSYMHITEELVYLRIQSR